MKTKTLRNALKENGLLNELKKVVSGTEKLSESQLRNVSAGSDDEPGCVIVIGPPCVIVIGPIDPSPPSTEEQSNKENSIT